MRTPTHHLIIGLSAALVLLSGAAMAQGGTAPSSGTYGSPGSGSTPSTSVPSSSGSDTSPMNSDTSGAAATNSAANDGVFTKLDTDKDGLISKKEASKNKDVAKQFSKLDVDKDGKLDQAEFARFEAAPGAGK